MAVSLIAIANGNLTTNTTWGTSNAGALNITGSTSVGITASYQLSSTFTPGAVTIDGIAVRVNTRPGSSGTLSIALDQGGSTVVGTEVTINVTDIPAAGTTWIMTQFTGVPLSGATLYSVKIKASGTSLVTCFATSGTNWLRQLRVPGTTATPGAGDAMYIFGEKTGAGAQTTRTVTMDDAAGGATVYGTMNVGAGGTLNYGTTGGINYYMKLAGNCTVYSGGTMTMGSAAGTRIPSNSTADLKFSNSSNVDFGLEILGSGTFTTGGNHNAVPWALLNADAIATATSLTTDQSTGWLTGDVIGIASTTRTASECESKALTGNASGTTLTITAITNAHGGNSSTKVQAELINLSRNVRISGTSTTFQAYMRTDTAVTVTLDDTEFFNMGSNTANKRGIDVSCTTGSFTANYCALHDFVVSGSVALFLNAASVSNVTIAHCVFNSTNTAAVSSNTATSGTSISITDCVGLSCSVIGTGSMFAHSYNQTIQDIRCAGVLNAGSGTSGIIITGGSYTGTVSSLVTHSNASAGITITPALNGTITGVTVWRNNGSGIMWGAQTDANMSFTLDTFTCFGNAQSGIAFTNAVQGLSLLNGTVRAGTVLTQPKGLSLNGAVNLSVVNTVFGGGGETHSTADVDLPSSGTSLNGVLFDNCQMNSSTQVNQQGNLISDSQVSLRANFLGQTQDHKAWFDRGTWSYDTAIAVVSPSLRMTPLLTGIKFISPTFYCGATNGQTVTASVAVRTSLVASGDAQTYNGNPPRLIARRNYGAGITSDQVLATASGASSGAFETISGATTAVGANCALEFYVDCDGTQGWVNVDSLSLLAA